jgi:hypothetical protein
MTAGNITNPLLFRKRAKELREMARRISPPMAQDLLQVALEWDRLADQAERENPPKAP